MARPLRDGVEALPADGGSGGVGASTHLVGVMLNLVAGTKILLDAPPIPRPARWLGPRERLDHLDAGLVRVDHAELAAVDDLIGRA